MFQVVDAAESREWRGPGDNKVIAVCFATGSGMKQNDYFCRYFVPGDLER